MLRAISLISCLRSSICIFSEYDARPRDMLAMALSGRHLTLLFAMVLALGFGFALPWDALLPGDRYVERVRGDSFVLLLLPWWIPFVWPPLPCGASWLPLYGSCVKDDDADDVAKVTAGLGGAQACGAPLMTCLTLSSGKMGSVLMARSGCLDGDGGSCELYEYAFKCVHVCARYMCVTSMR
jgi:hypothetical protein